MQIEISVKCIFEQMHFRSNVFSVKCICDQMNIQSNEYSSKCNFGQMIIQANVISANDFRPTVISGKRISRKCHFDQMHVRDLSVRSSECIFGELYVCSGKCTFGQFWQMYFLESVHSGKCIFWKVFLGQM